MVKLMDDRGPPLQLVALEQDKEEGGKEHHSAEVFPRALPSGVCLKENVLEVVL